MSTSSNRSLLELYVKASGIDSRRIGACLFCQEFWMELYALYEMGAVRVEVKTVNINSEAYKKKFLGAQPPILVENEIGTTYTDNEDIERRIFQLDSEYNVSLFEKDDAVDTSIESLYRIFKLYLKVKTDEDKQQQQIRSTDTAGTTSRTVAITRTQDGTSAHVVSAHNKVVEQLARIDQLLFKRKSRYLMGKRMTEYDCTLMPRLHHIRIVGQELLGFCIPHKFVYLWNYMLNAYRTPAFLESCPADQDILHHYKEQLNLGTTQRDGLKIPTKTRTIPEEVLATIHRLELG